MAQDHNRKNTRRTPAKFFIAYVLFATWLFACVPQRPAPAAAPQPRVTDTRILAAEVVYSTATADDWGQRAVIAHAALNAFESGVSPLPDTSGRERRGASFDPYLWQASLDAVDAVQSGSYAIPHACVRANAISPIAAAVRLPRSSGSPARTQCVIGDLAFVEVR